MLNEENTDRDIVYKSTAVKTGVSIDAMQEIFYKDHFRRAKTGTYFETENGWARKG